jgi:NADH:ubiquinone oxidoreductase subunit 3 (subunit A)
LTARQTDEAGIMEKAALVDLIYVMTFFLGALLLGIAPMVLSYFLAPRRTRAMEAKTLQAIECGVVPIGEAWIRYGVVYYLYALIFVAFSVDVLFLFPVAVIYKDHCGWLDLGLIALFVGILALVIVYAWKKGVFLWQSRLTSQEG